MSRKEHDHPQRWSTAQARSPPLAPRRGPCPALPCHSPARRTGALLASAPPDRDRTEPGGEGWYLRGSPPRGQRLQETEAPPGWAFLPARSAAGGTQGDTEGCGEPRGKPRCWPRAPPAASSGRPQPAGGQPSPPPAPHREQRDTPSSPTPSPRPPTGIGGSRPPASLCLSSAGRAEVRGAARSPTCGENRAAPEPTVSASQGSR